MAMWMLRGGRAGERERRMLEEGVLSVGWPELPDLTPVDSVEALAGIYRTTYADARETRVAGHAAQIFDFIRTARPGDLVVMPLSSRPAAAIGEISGEYGYRTDLGTGMAHTRPVGWLKRGLPRERIDAAILELFEGFMTFSRVASDAEEEALRATASDPEIPEMPLHAPAPSPVGPRAVRPVGRGQDPARLAREQILDAIGRKFRGVDFVRLVRGVLSAHGFVTGPTMGRAGGEVEFLAGGGPLGFGTAKLLVRVSGGGRLGSADALGDLRQAVESAGANEGLLVTWGRRETTEHGDSFFLLRQWDGDTLLDALLDGYDRLPEDIRSQIPLKKVWALAERR